MGGLQTGSWNQRGLTFYHLSYWSNWHEWCISLRSYLTLISSRDNAWIFVDRHGVFID